MKKNHTKEQDYIKKTSCYQLRDERFFTFPDDLNFLCQKKILVVQSVYIVDRRQNCFFRA